MRRLQFVAHRLRRIDPGLANPRLCLIDQRGHRLRLQVDPAANFVERVGRALEQGVDRRGRPARCFIDPRQRRTASRIDFGQLRNQALRRRGDRLVGIARSLGQSANLGLELRCLAKRRSTRRLQHVGHRACGRFGPRQILEQHAHVDPRCFRRAIERFALSSDAPGRSFEVIARRAKPHCRFVAEAHQLVADRLERGMIFVDPLAEHAEQPFERLRFVAHGDDRTRERLGFLAPRPAEHQPH